MSWNDIPGWFGFRETYDEMVDRASDGDSIVEIGVAFGRSLAYLTRRVLDSGKRVEVWGCDPWVDDWWMPPNEYPLDAPRPTWGGEYAETARALGGPFPAFCQHMLAHAREELGRARIFKGHNEELFRMFAHRDDGMGKYGPRFVMIDGNHNYDQVVCDIGRWRDRVEHERGILAGDDFSDDFPGVQRAVEEAFPGRYEVRGTTWIVRFG